MANRYRGAIYVGVTSNLAARIYAHREGRGSLIVRERGFTRLVWAERFEDIEHAIAFEKRLKRWRREWKFELIEKVNPDWHDLYDTLNA
jgi:putative endonuclease